MCDTIDLFEKRKTQRMRADELTQKFKMKGEICLKSKPDERWRILDAYDTSCYVKEVGGYDFKIVDYDVLDRDWQPYKKPRGQKKAVPQEGEDNFGNKLVVGDKVYYASSDYRGKNYRMNKGVVEGFTECKVIVSGKYLTSEKIAKMFIKKGQ